MILRIMLPPESAFALTTIVNAHVWAMRSCIFCECVMKSLIQTPIQNAVHGSTVHASLEKKTIRLPKIRHVLQFSHCVILPIVQSSSEPERRLYDVI